MRQILILLACVLWFGCNRSSAPSAGSVDSTQADAAKRQHAQSNNTAVSPEDPEKDLAQQIVRNMERARQFELKMDFQAARKTWQEVQRAVQQHYGADSWQATNARLALQSADQRAGMQYEQRKKMVELSSLQREADLLESQGKLPQAEAQWAKTVQLANQLFASPSHLVANYQLRHAQVLQQIGRAPEAVQLMRQVIETRAQTMTRRHPDCVDAIHRLGVLYQRLRQYDLAKPLLIESLELCQQLFGEHSAQAATYQNDLGACLSDAGEFSQAARHLAAAAQIRRDLYGADSVPFAHSQYNLGMADQAQGNLPAAQKALQTAYDVFKAQLGMEDESTLQTMQQLAANWLMRKDATQAESLLHQVVETRRKVNGPNHPAYARCVFQLAVALGNQGKYPQAEPLFVEALKVQENHPRVSREELIRTLSTYAVLLRKTNRLAEADKIQGQVTQISARQQ